MPIVPQPRATTLPAPVAGQPDPWQNADYYDVLLANMTAAFIASGQYAPGPLIMQLALAATAEVMYQTGRWLRPTLQDGVDLTPEAAAAIWAGFRVRGNGR